MLACEIKKNKMISGIKIGTNEYCILQYADDSTLTLKNKVSIIECIKILENFSTISGLKLNTKKCQGIWLGQLKGSENVFQQINFTKEPIKCLGIMSTPLGGGYIIFAFFAVRCPMSDVRRPASDVRRHAWFPLI